MILSNVDIEKCLNRKIIEVQPHVNNADIRQCGIRVHLAKIIYEYRETEEVIDLRDSRIMDNSVLENRFYHKINLADPIYKQTPYVLKPGETVLGSTIEKIKMPEYMVGFLDGRSTVARFGITNNITASFIDNMNNKDPKNITLEIHNAGKFKFSLYERLPIGMLVFAILSSQTTIDSSGQYADGQLIPNLQYTHDNNIF